MGQAVFLTWKKVLFDNPLVLGKSKIQSPDYKVHIIGTGIP